MPRLFLSPPHMGGSELRLIEETFASNYIAPAGPMITRFEKEFCEFTGFAHAAAVSSGTAALHLALRLAGVGKGDKVYCASLTFIGGVTPILFQGATPVFLDCDERSWTMDPHLLADALQKAAKQNALPKAVMPTDLYGQSCDLDAILEICAPYKIPVIVDSAESLGGRYKNRHCGNGALMAGYSFNGNKIITTSCGGMLASNDQKLIKEAQFLSHQARDAAPHYEHTTYGYNYRMSSVAAAIGCGQLEVLADRVKRRREIFARYQKALAGLPGITFMPEAEYGISNCWLTVITIDPGQFGATREDLRMALEAEDIESRPVWKPMHLQPVFKDCTIIGGSVSQRLFENGLCLPSGTQMSDTDQDRVIAIICARAAMNSIPQQSKALK